MTNEDGQLLESKLQTVSIEQESRIADETTGEIEQVNVLVITNADGSETRTDIVSRSGTETAVQADWLQDDETQPDAIKNRPLAAATGKISWSGSTEGRVIVNLDGVGPYYKVSDFAPENITSASMVFFDNEAYSRQEAVVLTPNDDLPLNIVFCDYGFAGLIAAEDIVTAELLAEKGVYFLKPSDALYPVCLEYTCSKFAPEYTYRPDWNQTDASQPDAIKNRPFGPVSASSTLTWDGNADGLTCALDALYLVSSDVDGIESADLANAKVVMSNGNELTFAEYGAVHNGFINIAEAVWIALEDNAAIADTGLILPEKGVYFYLSDDTYVAEFSVPSHGFMTYKRLDEKYLPGPIILYCDAEYYMYADSDVSDASKRVTVKQLRQFLYSGRPVYMTFADVFFPALIAFHADGYGLAATAFDSGVSFKTAEYVAPE